jgi:isopentenyl-diphosphate delta-isomerase
MLEKIYAYSLDNKHIVKEMDRSEFYKKQIKSFKKNGKVDEAIEIIQVFLFNTDGELLIQKRGKSKNHNPGLLDKSLGGHMKFGDTADYTVMVETVEELGTPSIVLRDPVDFEKTRLLLRNYRQNIAIIKLLNTDFFKLKKIINEEVIDIVNKAHVYVGVYDGYVKPEDKEASGVLWYNMDDLTEEMEKSPDLFTEDLKVYIDRFEKDLRDFAKYVEE